MEMKVNYPFQASASRNETAIARNVLILVHCAQSPSRGEIYIVYEALASF